MLGACWALCLHVTLFNLQGDKVAPKLSPEEAKDEAEATVRCHAVYCQLEIQRTLRCVECRCIGCMSVVPCAVAQVQEKLSAAGL
jgi:hypothetical protein